MKVVLNSFQMIIGLAALALSLWGNVASADIAPRPGQQSEYEVKFSQPISEAFLQGINFQNVETIRLGARCTAEVKTWERDGTQIVCQSRSSCFGRARPSCHIEFRSGRGQNSNAFCAVTEESPGGPNHGGGFPLSPPRLGGSQNDNHR